MNCPVTPVPIGKKRGVLGLGTPEVDIWLEASKGAAKAGRAEGKERHKEQGKTVGFRNESGNMDESDSGRFENEDEGERHHRERERERERHMTMQISPRRPTPSTSSTSWAPSPLRHPIPSSPGGAGGSAAHDLLRTIVRDVMYDFQRETKAEMMGLHLDLVRMGRGWKQELRVVMDECGLAGRGAEVLKELREENRVLREENERLKKGY